MSFRYFLSLVLFAGAAEAADLPPHGPLRILVVSDEVNPHGLPPASLTQPGDISAALLAPDSGLLLSPGGVREIPTDSLSEATAALSVSFDDPAAYDVVIYFAHRIPNGPSGLADQTAFVAAVEDFLVAGGGFVAFHHGMYSSAGKQSIQDVIGATASGAVPWNTVEGQNVIDVAPGHFITSNAVEYTGSVTYADAPRGIASDDYDFFNNTPDERYTTLEINPTAGTLLPLFASNYNQNGTTHLLGFVHRRPEWSGVVVGYQPAEYQPNALDDRDGNNFQILANAIVYASLEGTVSAPDAGLVPRPLAAFPNPTRAGARIEWGLAGEGPGSLTIFSASGRIVRTWEWGTPPGSILWDGNDREGRAVASGAYFLKLLSSRETRAGKLFVVR